MRTLSALPLTTIEGRFDKHQGLIIVAGDMYEYQSFLKEQGLPLDRDRYLFISDPMRLLGMFYATILCVGTYRRSPVLRFEGLEMLKRRNVIQFINCNGDAV
jgi:hypothetical protein